MSVCVYVCLCVSDWLNHLDLMQRLFGYFPLSLLSSPLVLHFFFTRLRLSRLYIPIPTMKTLKVLDFYQVPSTIMGYSSLIRFTCINVYECVLVCIYD